ncbi:MFS transporter [Candidatus Aquicultor secundus]|uniref:MFS transporter n=1 Tax=Candidatus Aquicultor secundus TaxID=1973895 RepID=UPI000CBB3230|nr:MFS transporter [Candidatus Aquicultor secundus]PIU27362.1 MAG: MFS transporter [Candidatus Aquicultor secundus]
MKVPEVIEKDTVKATKSNYHWYVLATVFVGTFMGPLDSSIVNIAIPSLTKYFSVGITTVEWVVMAYLLTTSSLLLSTGRLGDMVGHKRIYIIGFLTFTAASALCGISGSVQQLVFFRVVQAVGATCMFSSSPAILTDAFPTERGKALGLISISVAIGLTVGPTLGGFIVHNFGWRWIFFVNIPIGIIASIMAAFILKESKLPTVKRFDFAGATTAFLALFSVLLALSMGDKWGWRSSSTIGLLLAAVVFAAAFLYFENKVEEPMLDLSLFRIRLFTTANISALINYASLFIATFLTPFYLRDVFGESIQTTGLVLTVIPLFIGLVAPISGTLSDKIGSRMLSSLGLTINALALLGLSRTSVSTGILPVALFLGLFGFGAGLFQSPNSSAIMGAVPRHRLGIAAGMQATMRSVGMVLGVAMAGAIVGTYAPAGPADPHMASAIHIAFVSGSVIAGIGVVASLVRGGAVSVTQGALSGPAGPGKPDQG